MIILIRRRNKRGDDAQIVGDRLQLLGAVRAAVVDGGIGRPAGDDAEYQREEDVPVSFFAIADLPTFRPRTKPLGRARQASQRPGFAR